MRRHPPRPLSRTAKPRHRWPQGWTCRLQRPGLWLVQDHVARRERPHSGRWDLVCPDSHDGRSFAHVDNLADTIAPLTRHLAAHHPPPETALDTALDTAATVDPTAAAWTVHVTEHGRYELRITRDSLDLPADATPEQITAALEDAADLALAAHDPAVRQLSFQREVHTARPDTPPQPT